MREGTLQHEAELVYEAYLASTPMVMCTLRSMEKGAWSLHLPQTTPSWRCGGRRRASGTGASSPIGIEKKATPGPPRLTENALFHIKRRVATARYADKRLERFFRSINDIASGYLGEAQLSGYKVVRICVEILREPPRHRAEINCVCSMA